MLSGLLITAIIAFGIYWFSPKQVAKRYATQFVYKLLEGKPEPAYEKTSKALQDKFNLEDFSERVDYLQYYKRKITTVSLQSPKKDMVNVPIILSDPDDSPTLIGVSVIKEDGKWKVNKFDMIDDDLDNNISQTSR